jgi:hypothetical protein
MCSGRCHSGISGGGAQRNRQVRGPSCWTSESPRIPHDASSGTRHLDIDTKTAAYRWFPGSAGGRRTLGSPDERHGRVAPSPCPLRGTVPGPGGPAAARKARKRTVRQHVVPQGGGAPRIGHRCPGAGPTTGFLEALALRLVRPDHTVPDRDLRTSLRRVPARVRSGFAARDVRAPSERTVTAARPRSPRRAPCRRACFSS